MIVSQDRQTTEQRLVQALLQDGLISQETLESLAAIRRAQSVGLVEALYGLRGMKAAHLVSALSRVLQVPQVNLQSEDGQTDPAALALLDESLARRYRVLPLKLQGDSLLLAVGDPLNIGAVEELRAHLRRRIEPRLAPMPEIVDAIVIRYRSTEAIEEQVGQLKSAREEQAQAIRTEEDSPVVRTVNLLITQAIKDRASDIHIEPQKDRVLVRYRIDGILHEVLSFPAATLGQVVSRVKVMAEMNPAERRNPQDGQLSFRGDGHEVDIRIATAESVNGETMVLRLLSRRASFFNLSDLGFAPESLQRYERFLKHPFGMVLIAGPTGSGKTTTLYASLNRMDRSQRNIMTIEDPVEYRFDGITQLQVSKRYGISFATGLRALMRLDPDVILVGEIRDTETVQIGTQAALTGHLVLSSIHANDSASAVLRLLDLGADRFVAVASLVGIIAQRMVRRVCGYCAAPREASVEERAAYREITGEDRDTFSYGSGCTYCANTGYLGRTGIFELLEVDEPVQRLLMDGGSAAQVREAAIKGGMTTMLQDGMRKAREGVTTPAEVLRHVYGMH